MSGINHDTAARLLGIAPGELTILVRDGHVRRGAANEYAVPGLVQDYIGHLKAERDRLEISPKQTEIAAHLDMSDRAVREFLAAAGIEQKAETLSGIRVAYIRRQREVAAGRGAEGGVDLAAERALLARAQKERIEMQNAVTRGELAPVALIEEVLTKAASKVAGILDAIPGMIRRRVPLLTAADIERIAMEIAKARNRVAEMSLADLDVAEDEDHAEFPPLTIDEAA